MWSGKGSSIYFDPTADAAGAAGAAGGGADVQTIVNSAVSQINALPFGSSQENFDKILDVINSAIEKSPGDAQAIFSGILNGVDSNHRLMVQDVVSIAQRQAQEQSGGDTGAATGTSPAPRRRGRGGRSPAATGAAPGAQPANGQQQDNGMAEHHAEEAADRKYSINEAISSIESQIADLRAKLVEAGKSHEGEARQIAAEREKIASSIQQLEYSKQKLIDLQNRIAGKKDECDSLFARYANDIANWTWLSKNDICAEVQKNWAECIFMMIKAMNDMARAITGNGGQSILPSAPSSRAMAPAQPTDGLLQQEKGSFNDLQGAEREQKTAINAQDAQNGSALGQINREEANRQHQYEQSRQTLQEQVHRSEERLADLNQKLANVGINAAAGAAAAGGVST